MHMGKENALVKEKEEKTGYILQGYTLYKYNKEISISE